MILTGRGFVLEKTPLDHAPGVAARASFDQNIKTSRFVSAAPAFSLVSFSWPPETASPHPGACCGGLVAQGGP
jgi:hypothetical protein